MIEGLHDLAIFVPPVILKEGYMLPAQDQASLEGSAQKLHLLFSLLSYNGGQKLHAPNWSQPFFMALGQGQHKTDTSVVMSFA